MLEIIKPPVHVMPDAHLTLMILRFHWAPWILSGLSINNDSSTCISSDMPCRPDGKEKCKRREQPGRSNHSVRGIPAGIWIDGSAAVHVKSVECFLW